MKKMSKKALASATVMTLIMTSVVAAPASAATVEANVSGAGRVETSIQIAAKAYTTWKDSKVAVIANGLDGHLVDALAIAPLAYAKQAPIFLTMGTDKLEASIIDALKLQKVETVYIAGATVTAAVDKQLNDAGIKTVTHFSGSDRVDTASKINAEFEKVAKPAGYVVVNTNDSVADALSIASIAAKQGLAIVVAADKDSAPAVSGTVYAVGGTGVLSDALVTKLNAKRLAGSNRFETNAAVISNFDKVDFTTTYVADGTDAHLVDSLPGSILAGQTASPIILVSDSVGTKTSDLLAKQGSKVVKIVPLGGTVNKTILDAINAAVTGQGLGVNSVSAVKVNTLKVVFSSAVDSAKAVLSVKKGTASYNTQKVEWNDAKTEATLTMPTNLTAGDYSVTVTGVNMLAGKDSAKCTVTDQKVAKIELVTDKLVLAKGDATTARVSYKISDQYGESFEPSTITWNASVKDTIDGNKGVLTLVNAAKYTIDQKVVVSAFDSVTGIFMSSTVTVSPEAYVNGVTLGDVKSTDTNVTTMYTDNMSKFIIPVTLKDQYGNDIKDTAYGKSDLLPLNVNTNATLTKDSDGNLRYELSATTNQISGAASVTVVTTKSGNRTTKAFEIGKVAEITDFNMDMPDTIAAGDTNVVVSYTAMDQYGKAVTDVKTLNDFIAKASISKATGEELTFNFVKNYKTDKIELKFNAEKAVKGSHYLTLVNGTKVMTKTIVISEARKPIMIYGTKDLTTTMVKGAAGVVIKTDNIVLKDQYGTDFDWDKMGIGSVSIETSDAAKVSIAGASFTSAVKSVAVTAAAKGSSTITLKLTGTDGKVADGATYNFKLNVVDAADVKTYEVEDIKTIYVPMMANTADYNKAVKVTGKLEDGTKVILNNNVIKSVVTSSSKLSATALVLSAVPTDTRGTADVTAKVIVTIEGKDAAVVVTKDVVLSYAAPVATDLGTVDAVEKGVAYLTAAKANEATVDATLKALVTQKDQYGVAYAGPLTVVITNKATTVKAGDTFNVLVITDNGKTLIFKVVVTE